MNGRAGRMGMEIKDLTEGLGGKPVVDGFDAIVNRGEKIVIVGRNGAGKTTLLKALLADAPGADASPNDRDEGTIRFGHEVSVGYFPQDSTGLITKATTAVQPMHQVDPDAAPPHIHLTLA